MSSRRWSALRAASKAARAAFLASRVTSPSPSQPSSRSAPEIMASALETTAEWPSMREA